MNTKFLRAALAAGALVMAGAMALTGCSHGVKGVLFPNQPPTVEFTNAPVEKNVENPYFYAYRINWSGNDPDGRIDHYEYAVDPTLTDTVWVTTTKNEEIVFFSASQPDSIRGREQPTASDGHIFVLKAVDDDGAQSPRIRRDFYSYTIAPTVLITNPLPSALLRAQVTPSVRIDWTGSDPDGQFSQKPVKYKYKVLDLQDQDNQIYLSNPDSLRRREAARNFASWDSTSADTQFVQFTNLTPNHSYLFVLIGFDEAGAYSPVFDLYSNMLQMTCGFAASNGPRIHIFNQFIDYQYLSGGYTTNALREIPIEVPSHVRIDVNWDAFPPPGSRIQYFRWMVDGNVNDESPRTDENEDYIHWSLPSPTTPNSTNLRGFDDGEHRFYLECADNNGQRSLGILKMTAVTPSFDHNLLVIDDTRLEVDSYIGGCPINYTKRWPSRAELDTFLFARGNFPWRCTKNPTDGVMSTAGLLAGYSFDTLGTRLNLENPANGALLSKIGQYKNLIWLVDGEGGTYTDDLPQLAFPVTALASMSHPGRANTLGAYVQLGGRVWMAGGASAYASLKGFDKLTGTTNNVGQTTVFSSAPQWGELAPSRVMYDGAHWQSTVAVTKGGLSTFRYDFTLDTLRTVGDVRDTVRNVPFTVLRRPWSHYDRYSGATLYSPQYSKLPPEMRWKTPDTDPLPPTRVPGSEGLFYLTGHPCEYLMELNAIIEDTDPDPAIEHPQSVLDTLYYAQGVVLLTTPKPGQFPQAPTMTYYHGSQAHQFVFSGFAIWNYARQDCMDLVDFVLHDLWGMDRDNNVNRNPIAPALRKRGSSPARIVTPAQRTVSARVPSGTTRE